MTARIIDGKAFAAGLRARIGVAAAEFASTASRQAGLAVVLVGEDAASSVYVRSKERASAEAGIGGTVHRLPATTTQDELLTLVGTLNRDGTVDGILVQLPLPPQIHTETIIAAIDPHKDVDGFHPVNAGRLASGLPGFVPCTPLGCIMLLKDVHEHLAGLEATVVGRSNIVGKPMAQLLLQESCTVTIAHSRTRDLFGAIRRADILVAAVGIPEMIRGEWIKPGATVIDVGINRIDDGAGGTKLVGDVAYAEALAVAGAITPVPGGVGPMTIAVLLRNTLVAAHRNAGIALDESAL